MDRCKQRSGHYNILLVACEMYNVKQDHMSEKILFCKETKNTLVSHKLISRDHYPLIKHILIGWCKIFPLCVSPSRLYANGSGVKACH